MKPIDSTPKALKKIIESENKIEQSAQTLADTCHKNDTLQNMITVFSNIDDPLADVKLGLNDIRIKTGFEAFSNNLIKINDPFADLRRTFQQYQIHIGMESLLTSFKNSINSVISDTVKSIIANNISTIADEINSSLKALFSSVEFSSFKQLAEHLKFNYEAIKDICFDAMYECEWFPYAAMTADTKLFSDILEILDTSRGASKRRKQRIDKVILSYYTDNRIKQIKVQWRKTELGEKFINKILI